MSLTLTKRFLDEDFLLTNNTSRKLYHEYVKDLPIIDYHGHLPPEQIAENKQFENLTQIWLYGDHYKWRAMRTNGVDESYCTGNRSDYEKFQKWAETVPYTLRNPLYHWTHLELQRYFGIHDILNPGTAHKIYQKTESLLKTPEFSVKGILEKMKVEVICTTDDPVDSLEHHKKIKAEGGSTKVLPTFRPDKAMAVENTAFFISYVGLLEKASGLYISTFDDFLVALKSRHDYFGSLGCKLSDHGLEVFYAEDYTDEEIRNIFSKVRNGKELDLNEILKFKSAMLVHFALWDWEKGWTQQFHFGALRNNNSRMKNSLGADTGWDSIGDFEQGKSLSRFLDRLDSTNQLAKTILYNLNPKDNELVATMIGNFNDGSVAGKIQFGSGWWFLDQKDGMIKQMNALSNMGLLSKFVGMLTDSRSFMSFPRHEYFRRILCNMFGEDVENGELPNDIEWLGQTVQNISYYNAKNYFQF
jgi:glucuronate isomerase